MSTVIKVENLSKTYRLGQIGRASLQEEFSALWARLHGKPDPSIPVGEQTKTWRSGNLIYALQDINFEVKQGEVLGIIGKNGAGKSTLLKILSKVTAPSSGQIKVRGRIASLLEVGTGMHPELTGRENIFLNGAILGMRKSEIKQKLDAIIDFAGVNDYIDTPIKRYSSGMRVRLGFAVAAFLEPEILIVDEVLAVGDAEFQKKAIGKMQDVAQGEGRTVLFVSHNMQAISTLTHKAILMDKGEINIHGNTDEAIKNYLRLNVHSELVYKSTLILDKPQVESVTIQTSLPNNIHEWGKPLKIIIQLFTPKPLKGGALSFQIIRDDLVNITHLWLFDSQQPILRKSGKQQFICNITSPRLYLGKYSITIYLSEKDTNTKFEVLQHICPFEIKMYGVRREYEWQEKACTYLEDSHWEVNNI